MIDKIKKWKIWKWLGEGFEVFLEGLPILILLVFLGCLFSVIIYGVCIHIQFPLGSIDGWLSFFGGLCGGILAILGVCYTIINQNNQRKEDLRMQYKPLLIPTLQDCFITNANLPKIKITLKNSGRSEAINLKVVYESLSNVICNKASSVIAKDDSITIEIDFSKSQDAIKLISEVALPTSFVHSLTFFYTDTFKNEYAVKMTFKLTVKEDHSHADLQNNKYSKEWELKIISVEFSPE